MRIAKWNISTIKGIFKQIDFYLNQKLKDSPHVDHDRPILPQMVFHILLLITISITIILSHKFAMMSLSFYLQLSCICNGKIKTEHNIMVPCSFIANIELQRTHKLTLLYKITWITNMQWQLLNELINNNGLISLKLDHQVSFAFFFFFFMFVELQFDSRSHCQTKHSFRKFNLSRNCLDSFDSYWVSVKINWIIGKDCKRSRHMTKSIGKGQKHFYISPCYALHTKMALKIYAQQAILWQCQFCIQREEISSFLTHFCCCLLALKCLKCNVFFMYNVCTGNVLNVAHPPKSKRK